MRSVGGASQLAQGCRNGTAPQERGHDGLIERSACGRRLVRLGERPEGLQRVGGKRMVVLVDGRDEAIRAPYEIAFKAYRDVDWMSVVDRYEDPLQVRFGPGAPRAFMHDVKTVPAVIDHLHRPGFHPGRGGVEDIAKAYLFLLESEFTTGAVLDIDGGHALI